MINYLIYLIVRFLSEVFSFLPPHIALGIGRVLGHVFYIIYPNRIEVAYSNLLMVFNKGKNPYTLKRICKEAFINLSQVIIEVLRLPAVNDKYLEKYITISGLEYLQKALHKGNGVILLTAHFGNWELSAVCGALMGLPMKVLAREQKPQKVNEMLNLYRQTHGTKVIAKGFEVRDIIKSLHKNQCVGILADQDAGKTGTFINFLGKPASTASGPVVFAHRTKAKILPCFLIREKGPYHRLEMNPPLKLVHNKNKKDFVEDGLKQYSIITGDYIRKYTNQWLWFHKRWKSTPPTSLLILHDGKAGHLNQSKAVAKEIEKKLNKEYSQFPFKIKEIKIEFKNKLYKNFINICSNFTPKRCIGCLQCLKFSLTAESYQKVSQEYADIIVSCGSFTEGLNILKKRQCNAKNVIVMKPSMVRLNKFDLAIVPEHDRVAPKSNIVKTKGALNLIDKDLMNQETRKLQASGFKLQDGNKKIGVLIGGDTKNYSLSQELMDKIITELLNAAEELDVDLLVTTSRRTSKEIDNVVKKRLQNNSRCKLLVIANEKNIGGIVPAILGLSDIVIVSGESISMVSEAASSGKRVIVFEAEEKTGASYQLLGISYQVTGNRKKHKVFLNNLAKENYITLTSADELGLTTRKVWKRKKEIKKLDDRKIVNEAVRKLL